MKLWWPRSATIYPLQAGEPGNIIQHISKGQRTRNVNIWGQEQMEVPAQAKRKSTHPLSIVFALLILSAYPDDVCLHWEGWISILSLLNQMFISSKAQTNPGRMFYHQQPGASPGQSSKLAHKIDQHILFYDNGKYIHFWLYCKIFTVMDWLRS